MANPQAAASLPLQSGGGASPSNGWRRLWKVARWIGLGIWSILYKIFGGLLIGVGAGIILAFMAPVISENIAYVNPTCDEPRGVRVIPSTDIRVLGPTYFEKDGSKYPPKNALDGNPGSIWAPALQNEGSEEQLTFSGKDDAVRTLTLRFSGKKRDIALVCVVNGLAIEPWRYHNFGRVRNIVAWPDGNSDQRESTTLKTLDDGEMQNLQQVQINAGLMRSLHLAPIDAYHGEITESFDPDNCETRDLYLGLKRDPNGCIVNATHIAGLAEVIVFEVDPDAPGIWERLWSAFS